MSTILESTPTTGAAPTTAASTPRPTLVAIAIGIVTVAAVVAILFAGQAPLVAGLPGFSLVLAMPLLTQSKATGRHFKMTSVFGPLAVVIVGTLGALITGLAAPGDMRAMWWMLFTVAAISVPMALMQFGAVRRDAAEATR